MGIQNTGQSLKKRAPRKRFNVEKLNENESMVMDPPSALYEGVARGTEDMNRKSTARNGTEFGSDTNPI